MTKISSTEVTGKPNSNAKRKNSRPQACHIGNDHFQREPVRNNVCHGLKAKVHEGGRFYCILHSPDPEKNEEEFNNAVRERIEKNLLDFQAVIFPTLFYLDPGIVYGDADFSHAVFYAPVKFTDVVFGEKCIFDDAVFHQEVSFSASRFRNSSFKRTKFLGPVQFNARARFENKPDFDHAKFESEADFSNSIFKSGVSFDGAEFTGVHLSFQRTVFGDTVSFKKCVLDCYVTFAGRISHSMFMRKGNLSLDHAKIENPQNIHFQNVRLQATWFSNVDCKSFDFTDCVFLNESMESGIDYLQRYRDIGHGTPHLLRIYWRLAENCEESKQFEGASAFRARALDVSGSELKATKRFDTYFLNRWYWYTSLYAEVPIWTLFVLLALLYFFAIMYSGIEVQVCPKPIFPSILQGACTVRHLDLGEAIAQSLATATFQNIEHQKFLSPIGEILRSIEKILIPIQTAFLALAVRRKFLR